ncbi:MAG: hypothetical protein OXN97_14015 [Bryobacterales bacterium]|nr:hypothetical protein [Bryobacterales bacterium]MDE0624924.1 hypothetical protein [Bryobacterales bacterium]
MSGGRSLITPNGGNVSACGIKRFARSVGCTRIVAAEHAQDSRTVLPSHIHRRSRPDQLVQMLCGFERENLAVRRWRRLPENAK